MKSKLFILAIVSTFLMASCATIFTGTKDTSRFDFNPEGAKVYIDGIQVCKRPCKTADHRSLSDKLLKIKLAGYETRVIGLSKEFNTVSIINLGNLIGWVIDAATSSLIKYDKKGMFIYIDLLGDHHSYNRT